MARVTRLPMTPTMTNSVMVGRKTQTVRQVANQYQSMIQLPELSPIDCVYGGVGDNLRLYNGRLAMTGIDKYCATIQITDLQMKRVQSITDLDILANGLTATHDKSLRTAFIEHWDTRAEWNTHATAHAAEWFKKTNSCRYEFNPWVWVISFRYLYK